MARYRLAVLALMMVVGLSAWGQKMTSRPVTRAEFHTYSKDDLIDEIFNFRRALGMALPPDAAHSPPQPAPLKCGKYQHVVTKHPPDINRGNLQIHNITETNCADDLHTVTEKEWQELMERLKKLEDPCDRVHRTVQGCLSSLEKRK